MLGKVGYSVISQAMTPLDSASFDGGKYISKYKRAQAEIASQTPPPEEPLWWAAAARLEDRTDKRRDDCNLDDELDFSEVEVLQICGVWDFVIVLLFLLNKQVEISNISLVVCPGWP